VVLEWGRRSVQYIDRDLGDCRTRKGVVERVAAHFGLGFTPKKRSGRSPFPMNRRHHHREKTEIPRRICRRRCRDAAMLLHASAGRPSPSHRRGLHIATKDFSYRWLAVE